MVHCCSLCSKGVKCREWALSGVCVLLQIFPKMKNYTPYNRATSVGNQLLNNYRKFLLNYEICHRSRDLGGPIATPSAVTEVA